MTASMTKAALLQRLHAGYQQVEQLIAPLTSEQLQTKGVVGDWSIQDIIAHFIAHEQFALRELAAAQRDETYQNPYADTDVMNAEAVGQYAQLAVDHVMDAWEESFHQIITAVQLLADADFLADSAVVQRLGDTIDGALANNTYDHYAEHLPAMQTWIAQQ